MKLNEKQKKLKISLNAIKMKFYKKELFMNWINLVCLKLNEKQLFVNYIKNIICIEITLIINIL